MIIFFCNAFIWLITPGTKVMMCGALYCSWSVFVMNKDYDLFSQKVYMVMTHFVNCVGYAVYISGKKYFNFNDGGD